MICGHCKDKHSTVGEVRTCSQSTGLVPKPKTQVTVTSPGMYRIGDDVFQVVFNKDQTRLYAKKLVATYVAGKVHRIDFNYAAGDVYRLEPEHRMTVAQVAELGELTGFCWVCRRALKVAKSIAAGIGPVCAKKV
jgi:hypothetical protein